MAVGVARVPLAAKSDLRGRRPPAVGGDALPVRSRVDHGEDSPPGDRPRAAGSTGPRSPTTSSSSRARRRREESLRAREDKEADEDEEESAQARAGRARSPERQERARRLELRPVEAGGRRLPAQARALRGVQGARAQAGAAEEDAKIHSVYTPRVTEPLTSGRAYIYFFPLGQTEPAIVTLSDPEGEAFYSLVVHPLTGPRADLQRRRSSRRSGRQATTTRGSGCVQ